MAFVDVQLIEGLALPYVTGAESGLLDSSLAPEFNDAWQAFIADFPGKTLAPLFDELTVDELADMVDGIRFNGDEPPNPFVWFTVACDDAEADAVVAELTALPMVVFAGQRPDVVVAASVSYGTNPETGQTDQIQPSPRGIDAIYVWNVAGGAGDNARIVDLEKAWRLDHDELTSARINKLSVFSPSVVPRDVDHGTAVGGILVGSDNGVGTIGIVSKAELDLVTDIRASGASNPAAAINLVAAKFGPGDVLLIEIGQVIRPGAQTGEAPLEFDPRVRTAIRLATDRGITVIEPAGNGTFDLDGLGFFAPLSPRSPLFVNSGAVVVGAAVRTAADNTWTRTTFSTFGDRVDCFAAGESAISSTTTGVRAPSSVGTNTYQFFDGTSAASAQIAGAAASLQAMTVAASGSFLLPSDVRRLFRSASLGTLPNNPLGARIGSMPDLRAISRAQGLPRILPVGAASIGLNAVVMVQLDANNFIVRRHFTLLTGWGPPIPTLDVDGDQTASDSFELTAAQPAVTSSDETDPATRTVFDAYFSGPGGVHHMFWDTIDESGDVSKPIAPRTATAQGRALAAVRPLVTLVTLAGISPEGRLVVMTGDPPVLLSHISAPVILDPIGEYRRTDGPAIASRGLTSVDVVAIEDGGSLNWFTGSANLLTGGAFVGPFSDGAAAFDSGARPALQALGTVVLAAAVGADGLLRVVTFDPTTLTVGAPVTVDPTVTIAAQGPVALGLTSLNVVVIAVDTQGSLRAATRPIGGGAFTPFIAIPSAVVISSLGGVTAVSIDFGVLAVAIGADGTLFSALSPDGLIWSPLVPLPTFRSGA
jgi:hypothetical protein